MGLAPVSLSPAFLSLKQLAIVVSIGRQAAEMMWLAERREARRAWSGGLEAAALMVSGDHV